MGWELRRGKRVYIRKQRTPDGHVRSIYIGGGEVGERAAREDEERRAAKRSARVAPAENPGDSPSESSDTRAVSLPPDVQSPAPDLEQRREAARVAPAPLTVEEIVERALAQWPVAIRESRAAFIRRLLDRGMVLVACRSAGIGDKEVFDRGFQCRSLPESLPNSVFGAPKCV
jgi:hypothetical protein